VTRAVVFAYHKVGVRCLKVLLAHGVDVPLVVNPRDAPARPSGSTRRGDRRRVTAIGPHARGSEHPELAREIARSARLPVLVLTTADAEGAAAGLPARGALNLHGLLLRNTAGAPGQLGVLHGEREPARRCTT